MIAVKINERKVSWSTGFHLIEENFCGLCFICLGNIEEIKTFVGKAFEIN